MASETEKKKNVFIYYFLNAMSAERLLHGKNKVNNKSHAINKKLYEKTDRQNDRQIERQTDRMIDRQIERQTK